jgi:hypothetical protein
MAEGDIDTLLEQGLVRINEAILPSLSAMLDSLLDAASLARPGADADAYAGQIRALAAELESVTRQLEAVSKLRGAEAAPYRKSSAA